MNRIYLIILHEIILNKNYYKSYKISKKIFKIKYFNYDKIL